MTVPEACALIEALTLELSWARDDARQHALVARCALRYAVEQQQQAEAWLKAYESALKRAAR